MKENGPSRKANDIATITTMLQNCVGIKVTVTNAFCLGKMSDRPRLLKVSVSSIHEKSAILKQCYKLKNNVYTLTINCVYVVQPYIMHTHSIHTTSITLKHSTDVKIRQLIMKLSVLHSRELMLLATKMIRMFSEHTKVIADV